MSKKMVSSKGFLQKVTAAFLVYRCLLHVPPTSPAYSQHMNTIPLGVTELTITEFGNSRLKGFCVRNSPYGWGGNLLLFFYRCCHRPGLEFTTCVLVQSQLMCLWDRNCFDTSLYGIYDQENRALIPGLGKAWEKPLQKIFGSAEGKERQNVIALSLKGRQVVNGGGGQPTYV